MKAVTPVIALVMLMLITVGSVGMAYTWFSNMMTAQTEETIAIPIGGVQCVNNRISVIVTNTGANSNITDNDIVVAEINGTSVRNTPFFGGFNLNGLVGYWRFENDGRDYSGYGNTGSVYGAINTAGRFGNALRFDGVNDYVSYPSLGSGWSASTVTNWFKSSTGGSVISYRGGGACGSDGLPVVASDSFSLMCTDSGLFKVAYSGKDLRDGNWHFAATTFNGWNVSIYIDGSLVGTSTNFDSAQTVSFNFATNSIGAYLSNGQFFNGTIDEVMIWNRSLTPDEVAQLNKTNLGAFTLAPNKAVTLISRYPVFSKGKHTVRIGTRNSVIERTVDCL